MEHPTNRRENKESSIHNANPVPGVESDVESDVKSSDTAREKHERQPELTDGVVGWDSEDDAENPLNWSSRKKWVHLSIMALMTFMVYVVPVIGPILFLMYGITDH
ncbi:hypothetical protein BGW36DRAFT_410554 [Talaromyces proteolyticus]|uniref:Uncharacterized protein n=1 Tax=Talaromyces proteolyticus TaxID=1131652 RepID=A0AAD4KIR8_9EURO|nr:uncharacterized protein BGW36DRAFT_410554 [Talaromyces proteolyticus]KAH8692034.1 hypothetical protein BGW36DRAFT_410554 [Talaromyces proteolyticus]